ncbi:MAG TPA: DUF2569 family protein [Gemmatimonadales bacterium]|nr:DUF2569 family protein [Gemmatimonadales bacterium]
MQRPHLAGWLAVFRVCCLLGGFFYLFPLVEWSFIPATEWEKLTQLSPPVVRFRMFSQVQAVIVAAGLWWTFYLLVRPRPSTPRWALFALTLLVITDVIGFVMQESFIRALTSAMLARGDAVAPGEFTEARSHVILGIVGGVAWIFYFLTSRRVKNTFTALPT